MAEKELLAEIREEIGKRQGGLRKSGFIPAVVYGKGEEPTPLKVGSRDMEKIMAEVGQGHLLTLVYKKGRKKENKAVLIKEVQLDPIKRDILHVDFHAVALDKPVTTTVGIVFTGEEKRVADGGVLQHVVRELSISCLPTAIPGHIEVDVSGLKLGQDLLVSDLKVPEGVQVLTPGDEVVVAVVSPNKAEAEETPAAEGAAEGAAPAAAAPAEKKD